MNLQAIQSLLRELETDPQQLPVYYTQREESIVWLMDRTFESKDPNEKARLAMVEMRARGVLAVYRKANVN